MVHTHSSQFGLARRFIHWVVMLGLGICAIGSTAIARAADAPAGAPQPATQGAPATLKITIADVTGKVQFRASETDAWKEAKVGAELAEGAEFRTGPRSSVRCTIEPDQSFTLDRLGTVKVAQALWTGKKTKTDLMMKYGRTKLVVEGAGAEHESTISTPGGGLVVRGTVVSMYDQPPFLPEAVSYTGRAVFRDIHRQIAFGGKGQGTTTVTSGKDGAAETALDKSVVDPQFAGARTAADAKFIGSEVARGGIVSFDQLANITVVRNSPPITNDRLLAQTLPQGLSFVLRWTGNADINLEIFRAAGDPLTLLGSGKSFNANEFLYPGYNLNNVPSGGHIPFDHRGGPGGGTEVAFWAGRAPIGIYGVEARFISGIPVDLQFNAFLNGKKQIIETIDSQGNLLDQLDLKARFTATSSPVGGLVYIPSIFVGAAPATASAKSVPAAGAATHTVAAPKPPSPANNGTGSGAAVRRAR